MKLLIAGSRSIENFDLTNYIPPETDLIISGGAKGIDEIAENFADQILIIWDGISHGTKHTVSYAKKTKISCFLSYKNC